MIGGNPAIGGPLSAQNPDYASCPANNLYAPIPYQNGIIVTYTGTNPQWYNIQYQQYAAGTQVTSFTSATPTSGTNAAALANANQCALQPGCRSRRHREPRRRPRADRWQPANTSRICLPAAAGPCVNCR